MLKTPSYD